MLNSDDLEVGIVFTVLNDHHTEDKVSINGSVTTISSNRYSKGRPYKITAVNRPFIACEYISLYDNKTTTVVMDTRELDLIKLSDEYVKSLSKL